MTIVIIVRFAYETVAVLIYSYKVWIFEGTAVSLGLFSILYHSRCCARAPKTFLDQKGVYFSCSGYLVCVFFLTAKGYFVIFIERLDLFEPYGAGFVGFRTFPNGFDLSWWILFRFNFGFSLEGSFLGGMRATWLRKIS